MRKYYLLFAWGTVEFCVVLGILYVMFKPFPISRLQTLVFQKQKETPRLSTSDRVGPWINTISQEQEITGVLGAQTQKTKQESSRAESI